MSLLQEAETKSKLITGFVNDIERLNKEMLSGSLRAVGDMWKTLDNHVGPFVDDTSAIEFKEMVVQVGLRQATTVHLAHNFMQRANDNFGESEAGFDPISIPTVKEMFKSLAEFIDAGMRVTDTNDKFQDPLEAYGRTLRLYEGLIDETNEKDRTSDHKGWIKL